jgi:6-phosphogluconolactonase
MYPSTRWHVLTDAASVAEEAARRALAASSEAISERGGFRIVLAGGSTPLLTYRSLSRAATNWSRWQIYFGDERCLPPDDAERNSKAAAHAWLDLIPIPAENIHPIPTERGAEAAAEAYAPLVKTALPFDLVILGMGEDGHTASLFPGQVHPAAALTHAVHNAPKPPPDRVSLSAHALSRARQILILVTGAGKSDAVSAWKAGESLPVATIGGDAVVDVLIDQEANQAKSD